ncbi:hypothetical protein CALCODRAFT_479653 [Calocera cornea HHB12733]|uniref:Uncharacterized protein n=1 Tax=Calocera cornea HHB12733 TaxID=1353952 RepID=A0A165JJ37_9BASI|nr:hypothetical protein CALCODRAFT_479653 [Calocera cornea HHB12733]
MFALRSLNLFVLALLFLAMSPALASPTPTEPSMTNAERFRRGLPPNKPIKLYNASIVDTARKARRS